MSAELIFVNMVRFGAEGVRYLEPQTQVFNQIDRAGRVLDPEDVARIFEERLTRPDAVATGVTVRFQYVVLRFLPGAEADVERAYAFLDKHRARWVGINMAGREDRQIGHPSRFLATYRKMRRTYSGIGVSIHAGETDEPDHHVRETLLLGATRIGHAVNLIDDGETMPLMRQQQYLVEVNLISNRLLEYVPDLTRHPFPEYLRFGIPVCLNTDDRGMWGSDMTDEYYTALTLYRLTWPEIVGLGRNSLAYGFEPAPEKAALLADYDRRVAAFEGKYNRDDWTAALPAGAAVAHTYYAEKNFRGCLREGRRLLAMTQEYNFFAYMLASSTCSVLYIGVTNDLERRLYQHRHGEYAGFTKQYQVDRLVYYEQCPEILAVLDREKQLKGWRREKKNVLIATMNPRWTDLSAGWNIG